MKGFARASVYCGLLVSFLASSVERFFFSGFTTYLSNDVYSESSVLSYDERVRYISSAVEETSWIESIVNGVQHPEFWFVYLHNFAIYCILAWFSYAVLAIFMKITKSSE